MKNKFKIIVLWILLAYPVLSIQAYRIEVTTTLAVHTPVFIAGYYGEYVSVIDSTQVDANGKVIFTRSYDLCPGIYTIVVPGKSSYDLLIESEQQLNIRWGDSSNTKVSGDVQTAAYAEYLTWLDNRPDKQLVIERRQQIIKEHPGTFLATYLTALQPVEGNIPETTGDLNQMMETYQYRRRHFFDHMDLSDVRLLRTPLYHETVKYYVTKFITQQTDTLIHVAYRMLEQASGNYETFFYMSDFLIDFSLRTKIKDINKLHNFVLRNRDMLGTKAFSLISTKSKTNYFKLPDEKAFQDRLENMSLTDTDGQVFNPQTVRSKYRIFYFWKNDCPRCVADASRWQTVLNKYQNKSCFGVVVNTKNDVHQQENRILAYEPLCVNVSIGNMPLCAYHFFATYYSKIVVTDTNGNIVGIFGSSASLDNFLKII